MKRMKRNFAFSLIVGLFLVLCTSPLFTEIQFSISGKVIYFSKPISGIKVRCNKAEGGVSVDAISNESGYFSFYVPNGIYQLDIVSDGEYIDSAQTPKIITVQNKNVRNANFLLEKGCKISGYVKTVDNISLNNASIFVENERCVVVAETDGTGYYLVKGLKSSNNNKITVQPFEMEPQIKSSISCNEGEWIKNINFTFENRISILGKIIDKTNKTPVNKVLVILSDGSNKKYQSVSDINGEFKFKNLQPDKYNIICINPFFKSFETKILINSNELKKIEIELEKSSIDEFDKYFNK